MYKIVASFMMKNNYTTLIDEMLSNEISLNPNKNYSLMLYSFSYSNVFPNITQNLIISPSNSWLINGVSVPEKIIVAPILCDIDYLLNEISTATNNKMLLKINQYGKVEISFDASVLTVNISSSDLGILSTPYLGEFSSSITSTIIVSSPKVPVISSFNYLILTSNLIGNNSYIKTTNDRLTPSLAIYSCPANDAPYSFNSYVSRINLFWDISVRNIQNITFQLLNENLEKLPIMPGAQTDFSVSFSIVEMLN